MVDAIASTSFLRVSSSRLKHKSKQALLLSDCLNWLNKKYKVVGVYIHKKDKKYKADTDSPDVNSTTKR